MRRDAQHLGDESGFTLPELLIGVAIALVIAAAGMMVVTIAVKSQPRISDRAAQIQQGRTMLERLSRELRQGDDVTDATTTALRVHTFVDGSDCGGVQGTAVPCWVDYACSADTCTRTVEGDSAEIVVSGIRSPDIFCYAPWDGQSACGAPAGADPSYIALRLSFPADDGGETVTLDDGISLRNRAA
jgi:prepilin-type N-terminal cleavage/methylation domain-containing protein